MILIDSIFRTGKNYCPQFFLEECKYVVKDKEMPKYITGNIEICSDDFDKDKESSDYFDKEHSNDESNFESATFSDKTIINLKDFLHTIFKGAYLEFYYSYSNKRRHSVFL